MQPSVKNSRLLHHSGTFLFLSHPFPIPYFPFQFFPHSLVPVSLSSLPYNQLVYSTSQSPLHLPFSSHSSIPSSPLPFPFLPCPLPSLSCPYLHQRPRLGCYLSIDQKTSRYSRLMSSPAPPVPLLRFLFPLSSFRCLESWERCRERRGERRAESIRKNKEG